MTQPNITCPLCSGEFPLTETLAQPLLQAERAALDATHRRAAESLRQKEHQFASRQRELDEARLGLEQTVATKVAAGVAALRQDVEQRVRNEVGVDLQSLRDSLAEKEAALQQAHAEELELRRARRELEQKQQDLELTVQRTLDAERQRIAAQARQAADEAHRLKLAEKDTIIAEVKKQLDEARRASETTSQQLQGDVQEADLARVLGGAFPRDEILRTHKGQNGADVVQRVIGTRGQECGTILWECKRTKHWSDAWLSKLRDDQRAEGADVAVLVSAALPDGVHHFAEREGVWIASPQFAEHLAAALRQQLTQVAQARTALLGQQEKTAQVYAYVTGPEFRQRLQAIAEAFTEMQNELEAEKRASTQRWSRRKKQLDRMLQNTLGLYGDVEGISGASLPALAALPAGQDDGANALTLEQG